MDNFMNLEDFGIKYEPPKSPYEVLPRQHISLLNKMGQQDTRGQIEDYAKRVSSGESLETIDLKDRASDHAKLAQQLASQTANMDEATFERMRQALAAKVAQRPQMPMVQQAEAPTTGQQIVAALGSILFPQYAAKVGTLPYQAQAERAKMANENAGRQYQDAFDLYKQGVDMAAGDIQDFQRREQFRVNEANDQTRLRSNLEQQEANRLYGEISKIRDGQETERIRAYDSMMKADTPAEVEIAASRLRQSGVTVDPATINMAKQGATIKSQAEGRRQMELLQLQMDRAGGITDETQRKGYMQYAQAIADQYGIPVPPVFIGRNIKGQQVDISRASLDERITERKVRYKYLSQKEANNVNAAFQRLQVARQNAQTAIDRLGFDKYKATPGYIELTKAIKDSRAPVIASADKLKGQMVRTAAQMRSTADAEQKAKMQAELDGIAAELSQTVEDAGASKLLDAKEVTAYQTSIAKAYGYRVDAPPAKTPGQPAPMPGTLPPVMPITNRGKPGLLDSLIVTPTARPKPKTTTKPKAPAAPKTPTKKTPAKAGVDFTWDK